MTAERPADIIGMEETEAAECGSPDYVLRELVAEINALQADLAEAREDTERLDTMMKPDGYGECLQLRFGLPSGRGHVWY